ncbi:cytosine permease [Klebsiella pneumoniae subsp. pneumoniae]|nr:cytosine permease [Klebsiella pneumoniae subsp. pneumoniae]
MVLFSFTFFTGTMFAGGKLGVSFSIVNLLWIAVIGNALLALYAASLGWIAARSGLNTVLMGRFCFGEIGRQAGRFYSWFCRAGLVRLGHRHGRYLAGEDPRSLPEALTQPLMVLFGILFCLTALVGYKGLDALSRLSVPLMFVLLMVSMYLALHHAGGWQAMTRIAPSDTMTWSAAITMVFGTFASEATQATNWTRLANSSRTAILASMGSFLIGNGLMIVAGAWCAIVYQQADIVEVLILQGLSVAAVIMLCLNLLTIQGPTIYNVSRRRLPSAAQRTSPDADPRRRRGGHCAGHWRDVRNADPFLVLLGSIIPPIGGVRSSPTTGSPAAGAIPCCRTPACRVLTGWDSAPTPPARWWPIFRRGSRRWWGSTVSALVYIVLTLLSKRQPAAVAEQEP